MATDQSTSEATSARQVAFRVVSRTLADGAFADRAFHAEAKALVGRDRSFAKQLAFGAVQRRGSLDWVIDQHVDRELDTPIRAALHIGLQQMLFMSVADHAAIGESVELVRRHKGHKLVNAVLRSVQRKGVQWPGELDAGAAAITHSLPLWIARMWWDWLGPDEARALMAACNTPAEQALRINPLAGVGVELPGRRIGDALLPDAPLDLFEVDLYKAGAITPQSSASQRVSEWVDPQPGERILELCAAPGGKTAHLAALSGDSAEIVAVEIDRKRAAATRQQLERMKVTSATVVEANAARLPDLGGRFDRVLLDPPCTGLGTLQRHPDLRWRVHRADVDRLADLQGQMLEQALSWLAPGGRIVYSVCTLSPKEERELGESVRLMPHSDHTDGFYISRNG